MENKKFKPLLDKMFFMIWIPTSILLLVVTMLSFVDLLALVFMLFIDAFIGYFLVSPLYGYVELREQTVYVKLGFIVEREIPYSKIRGVSKERKFYADSMVSLKNALEHVNIKYNKFDLLSVSVVGNDELMKEIEARISSDKE